MIMDKMFNKKAETFLTEPFNGIKIFLVSARTELYKPSSMCVRRTMPTNTSLGSAFGTTMIMAIMANEIESTARKWKTDAGFERCHATAPASPGGYRQVG
jgi:hypothetical protein